MGIYRRRTSVRFPEYNDYGNKTVSIVPVRRLVHTSEETLDKTEVSVLTNGYKVGGCFVVLVGVSGPKFPSEMVNDSLVVTGIDLLPLVGIVHVSEIGTRTSLSFGRTL